ncbi:hypothetical protein LGH82_22070 [Mesorhizobium sp. PAMC28654]|uniref:hypothetical protein n=1 Tax=Mesorhizobium sp. PAMC28654 TaxID=2880934 RepID=UPI001D0A874A|nr:hypothetical protein [Mesorhizobium sp. PAMC28654]UDL87839.1 hypothetical protein LGH82_22070 [Mesorhizobium sp. PAMC28654]
MEYQSMELSPDVAHDRKRRRILCSSPFAINWLFARLLFRDDVVCKRDLFRPIVPRCDPQLAACAAVFLC